jgi:hypothetical protein
VVSVTPRPRFTAGDRTPPVTTGQEAGWASELVWTQRLEQKSFASATDRTTVVQSAFRHYTVWVTPALPPHPIHLKYILSFHLRVDLRRFPTKIWWIFCIFTALVTFSVHVISLDFNALATVKVKYNLWGFSSCSCLHSFGNHFSHVSLPSSAHSYQAPCSYHKIVLINWHHQVQLFLTFLLICFDHLSPSLTLRRRSFYK